MGSDIYSIGKTTDDNQILQGRELLDKLLTEDLSVSGYLSCAYDTERFLVLQVNIPSGKENNRGINDLFEIGRIIGIKECVIAKVIILNILPFLFGSYAVYRVEKVL